MQQGNHSVADPQLRRKPVGFYKAEEARNRRKKFLELYATGLTVEETCKQIGVSLSAYGHWRAKHKDFAAEVDAMRGTVRGDAPPDPGQFTGFRKKYFKFDTYPHQARIINEIENAKPGEVVMILVPPEWGKTTLLEDYCNWRIAKDPNVRITLVSEGQPHARKILGRVQKRMTDRVIADAYITDFGPFQSLRSEAAGKRWSADYFTVFQASHDERDYTMEARGWKSRIAGTRTDLLLIDDIQSAVSLTATDKMVTTFRQDMLTRPGKTGVTIIVGTRVGNGDFYETIQDADIVDRVVVLSALTSEGESNCPEMWPTDELLKRRKKVGEDVWWRTYMQRPRMSGTATFNEELLDNAKDLTRVIGDMPDEGLIGIGLDPALTGYNALVVAGLTDDSFDLIDLRHDNQLGSTEQVLVLVDRFAAMYQPDFLVVESNAYQKGLANDNRLRDLAREHGFRVIDHQTGRNKLDESLGVARMPTSFMRGEISIPWGDERSHSVMGLLVEELGNWRPDVKTRHLRQDLVMAMWFLWLEWQRTRIKLSADAEDWRSAALPWSPMNNPFRRAF